MMNIIAKFSFLISILIIIGCGGGSDESGDDNKSNEVLDNIIFDELSALTITLLAGADITVPRGAEDIVVSRIQAKAKVDKNLFVMIDELEYKITSTSKFSENNLPMNSISEVYFNFWR